MLEFSSSAFRYERTFHPRSSSGEVESRVRVTGLSAVPTPKPSPGESSYTFDFIRGYLNYSASATDGDALALLYSLFTFSS